MKDVMQHFRPEEQSFIVQVNDWMNDVRNHYTPKLTSFLDPRQVMIIQSLVGENSDVKMQAYGAFSQAERQRVILYPDYFEPEISDFMLEIFELNYPSKFIQLKHPDVLGSLLGIGLNRSKFGDIRLNEQKIQFVVQKEISNFIEINLEAINKVKVHLKRLSEESKLLENEEQWREQQDTVSSLRLDTVLAAAYKISRQKAAQLIQNSYVKVNYRLQESTSFELTEGDLLSVRGYGRLQIFSIEGRTKKDKIRIIFKKLERNS